MIDEEWRYFAPGGAITPGGPSQWFILDWDQRRIIAVTMGEAQDSEDTAIGHLTKHIDALGTDVYAIQLSQDGDLVSVSTDPKDDQATWVYYPPLEAIQLPDHVNSKTIIRSDLLELDRLGPNVDLVSYTPDTNAPARKVVFKYYFMIQFLFKRWYEMNLWFRLPPHPHIVPFDRLVVDELANRVVGFTSVFIPGGTIEENISRPFKLVWLQQLMSVIDDLNLKYGVVHQDVAPRNLLVDPATDALMLFDFNFSGQIGGIGHIPTRNDVTGVVFTLYEIITRDEHFREVSHEKQNIADVLGMEEWIQHPDVRLDSSVEEYRVVLNEWVERRRLGKQVEVYTEAPEYIDWPDSPDPPESELVFRDLEGCPMFTEKGIFKWGYRRIERDNGKAVLAWERPAQVKLRDGDRVFADGRLVRM